MSELLEAAKSTTAALVAAVSLLKRGSKKVAPSNTMFDIMIADYEKAIETARSAIAGAEHSGLVTVRRADVERLETIERAAIRLAYIVRKSVNAGPISNDPTSEGQAWRALRAALGEATP